jgi:hypothetical protein
LLSIVSLGGKLIMKLSKRALAEFQRVGAEGGKTAASRMSAKQRTERARKAAAASAKVRQAKARAKGGKQ